MDVSTVAWLRSRSNDPFDTGIRSRRRRPRRGLGRRRGGGAWPRQGMGVKRALAWSRLAVAGPVSVRVNVFVYDTRIANRLALMHPQNV